MEKFMEKEEIKEQLDIAKKSMGFTGWSMKQILARF